MTRPLPPGHTRHRDHVHGPDFYAPRPPAPALSDAEAAVVARFEAAPVLPESWAGLHTAAADAVREMPGDWWCPEREFTSRRDCEFCIAEVAVDAAIAALDVS